MTVDHALTDTFWIMQVVQLGQHTLDSDWADARTLEDVAVIDQHVPRPDKIYCLDSPTSDLPKRGAKGSFFGLKGLAVVRDMAY